MADAATALGRAGSEAEAEKLAAELAQARPLDQFTQYVDVPGIRAAIELNRGSAAKALDLLEPSKPYDRANTLTRLLRAEAYLHAGRASDAEQEFQGLIALKSAHPTDPRIPLAQVGLARAYALAGDRTQARAAYQDFLALWKDADPDIPILNEAKAEYAKLQ
jgi:predicted Zn-dependent protease